MKKDFTFRIIINNSQTLVGEGTEYAVDEDAAKAQATAAFLAHCENCGQVPPPEGTYTVAVP